MATILHFVLLSCMPLSTPETPGEKTLQIERSVNASLHGQIYSNGPGTLCRKIGDTSHWPLMDVLYLSCDHLHILASFPHWERNEPHCLVCVVNSFTPCIFELSVADLDYVPFSLSALLLYL